MNINREQIANENRNLDFDLFDTLACFRCKGELTRVLEETKEYLVCPKCPDKYSIKDGVPIFKNVDLPPEYSDEFESVSSQVKKKYGNKFYRKLFSLYRHPLKISAEGKKITQAYLPDILSQKAKILNLGSGEFAKANLTLFKKFERRIVNFDIDYFENVHVVGDGHELPFKDDLFDLVYLSCVLEHVRDASAVVKECHRVLKHDGLIFSTTPFVSRHHSDSDYRRWTLMGLDFLFRNFDRVESGIYCGPASAVALSLREFFSAFFNNRFLHFSVKFVTSLCLIPLSYLDLFLNRRKTSYKLAQSYYWLGKKCVPQESQSDKMKFDNEDK
ncbi:MAG: methyltransferase domain-containing protein [Candidatus Aminicenantes bacterium]|nr:MAG: methyltransferase domain-containing protein [Candidatus Aminicenantes bacterium]